MGFHDAEVTEVPLVRLNAVRGVVRLTAAGAVGCPGVNVPLPEVAVAGPDQ